MAEPDGKPTVSDGNEPGGDPGGHGVNAGDVGSGDSNGGDGRIFVDPTAAAGAARAGDGNDNTGRSRRGRPRGSGKSGKANSSLDVNGIEATLFSIHTMGAALLATPELVIDKDEAKTLALAINNVQRHYDVVVSQKTIDWTNLIGVVGMIYGTRLFAARTRRARERAERKAARQANANAGLPAEMVLDPAPHFHPGAGFINPNGRPN